MWSDGTTLVKQFEFKFVNINYLDNVNDLMLLIYFYSVIVPKTCKICTFCTI